MLFVPTLYLAIQAISVHVGVQKACNAFSVCKVGLNFIQADRFRLFF